MALEQPYGPGYLNIAGAIYRFITNFRDLAISSAYVRLCGMLWELVEPRYSIVTFFPSNGRDRDRAFLLLSLR